MKKRKIIFILIASILTVVIANAFWIRGALIDQRAGFPKSIKLGSVLYENKKVNMAGPGGLSRKLTVYEIPAKSVDRISEGGVDLPEINATVDRGKGSDQTSPSL